MHSSSRFPSRTLLVLGVIALASIPTVHLANTTVLVAADASCPPGFEIARAESETALPADALPQYQGPAPAGLETRLLAGTCVPSAQPETFAELALMNAARASQDSAPYSSIHPRAQLAAVREGRALARTPTRIRGVKGRWRALGKGPLRADVEGYGSVTPLDWKALSGRISDFTYDEKTNRLWTAVANGGVWMSKDLGEHWKSVGNDLPTQVVGSIAFSPVSRGLLVAATGDNGWGANSNNGLGVFRNVVGKKKWKRAKGVPAGALGFKVAVDPTNPKEIYAATSFGLYRSTNAGKSFKNVKLPTGEERCIGHPYRKGCFLRSHVTDVVVQAPDDFGHEGGKVLAAVGWRAGTKENADGSVQATDNGLYSSDTGKPGSFAKLAAPGFAQQDQIGRIELGAATGAEQDHNYVYAVVQDAVKFNGGAPVLDANDNPAGPVPFVTVLDGIYVSPDFGATWVKMATAEELQAPGTGSSLTGAGIASFYQPGVQAWYNEWIQPDPTRQLNGIPTRLTFGLEEVWQNEVTQLPQNGKSQFKVIGRYWGACQFRDTGLPLCPTDREPFDSTTTHPDQHGAIYVPDREGGVTLVVGNDGGVYKQKVAEGEEFSNGGWGGGAQLGLHTLLPYDARIAKDGTVWAGLQDNGQIKITPKGEQIMTYGGDGFYAAVEPNNSDIAYEEYVGGVMSVTTDGGKTWRSIDPGLTNPAFSTPFMMDPLDPDHLIIGGRDIAVTVQGEQTSSSTWRRVYDLGTQKNPGQADAVAADDDPDNRLSAVDLHGKSAYVGFCGWCDVITQGTPFNNGLATNVAGDKAPVKGGPEGWHIAKAKGLPNRFITSIEIDPKKPKTIYLTLAGYSGRRWAPPGVVGEKPINVGKGHVFKSTNAGKSFKNITGNLPNSPANYVIRRGKQLIVATDIGVFISKNLKGKKWAKLGKGLPTAPVLTLQLKPGNPNIMVVATFGRGVYEYRFK